MVNASIITIGDELLIGQTIDTNSAFIAQQLNGIGIWVKRRIAVGDVKDEIIQAMSREGSDCSVVIITGGLGPTADDITKPTLCEFFNSTLVVNENALQNVKDIFNKLNRPLTERNLKQAEVPDNCQVLQNRRGTAPGMWFGAPRSGGQRGAIFICLPGVPHEMRGLMEDAVIPKLKHELSLPAIIHRTILTAGQGESFIADRLSEFENNLPDHIKLAYLPAYGMLRLRLTGTGENHSALETEMKKQFTTLKQLISDYLVADEDIGIEEAVRMLLNQRKETLSTAESCTGGYIGHLITSRPGSSAIFKGSIVSYA